jgi:putative glutamine amidotransferase
MKTYGTAPRRPSIGLTPDFTDSRPDSPLAYYELKVAYADAVLRAGGLPLVMPYSDEPGSVESYLDRLSGLIVTGGAFDVPPEAYGEAPREGLGPLKPGRTAFETALLRAALQRNLPVLGICGGMQLLNVVLGGTLYQDISRELPHTTQHEQKHDRSNPQHPVDVKDGTLLGEAMGRGAVMVNSTHHQAVNKVGEGLVVSAAASDGVVEGIESTQHAFVVGVQWHPELLTQSIPAHGGLYRTFIQKAREYRR